MACAPTLPSSPSIEPKKRLRTRKGADRTQLVRRAVQLGFLALNVWIGIEFYLFVRFYETAGASAWMARPSGIEGWLPIASLMNVRFWLSTGQIPSTHAAGMFLLLAFASMSLLLRKAFCGWLCPVGTISEYLWKLGRQTFGRTFRLGRWADYPLRSLKYGLLGLFLYAVGGMSAIAIRAFLEGPYGVVADVKMLNFFRYLSVTAAVVIGALVLLSVFIQNFWCRYLCPYGALLGLFAIASPVRIRRDPELCIDCSKCSKACPSALPVDQLVQIRSAECTACYQCVSVCPAGGALDMAGPGRRVLPAWAMAAGVAIVFLGFVGYAQWAGHWSANVPSAVYQDLIPRANEFGHP